MIQILENNSPGKQRSDAFSKLSAGLGMAGESFGGAIRGRQERNALAEEFGEKFNNIRDPNVQRQLLSGSLEEKKHERELTEGLQDVQAIEDQWGKEFADIYKAASVGGKTKLLQAGIDAMMRGEDITDTLKNLPLGGREDRAAGAEREVPQLSNGRIPKDFELPDYSKRPKGYTPSEWTKEKATWRKENSPVYDETKKRLKSNATDARGIKNLRNLNATGKVGEGFGRLLINPNTGDFYGIAQLTGAVPPEAQEWVKEIARFQNRAKEAFGSRVTNFDLMSYMKQFPGLLNTHEGRNRILDLMEINNKLDHLYDSSLNQIYQKKGLSGIPQEQADLLAKEMIADETEKLDEEYLNLVNRGGTTDESESNLPSGTILMLDPQGNPLHVPREQVEQLMSLGARLANE